ncbi:trichoplein keratin filament-binding protein [Clonorchis sinensis]|uniref:Trichoplein keratin filament-binding protein n=1 Tax=Clonorchis sinensis TaxID=79923 RepID=H2KNX0_CLOSI|nr:trichoplein keratin filament-binding protein [Clonorchis sinensis]
MEAFEVQNVDREAEKIIDNRRRRLRSLLDKETKQQMVNLRPPKTHTSSDERNVAKFEEPVEEVESGGQMAMAKEAEKLEQQQKRLRVLQDQLDELNQRENEADRLVEEENQLTRILARLDKFELQLCALEDKYKQEFNRRAPLRQHNATLRRRSTTIQNELKSQLEWLERFASQCTQGENSEDKVNSDSVKAVRQIVEADLEKEKKFVLELDILLGHEAAALWNNKESSWIQEASSRYKLLLQLLENRRHNTVAQLEKVHRRQREELRSREALLEKVEKIRDEQFPNADPQQYQSSQDCDDPPERTVEGHQFPHNQDAIYKAEKAYEEILRKEADKLKATEISTLQPTRQRPGLPYPYFKPGGNIW